MNTDGNGSEARGRIIGALAALALVGLVLVTADAAEARDTERANTSPVIQPKGNCAAWIGRYGNALGICYVFRGEQVRLRADCIAFPDLYSAWKGYTGSRQRFSTRACPFGIRGPIWNTRAA